MRSRFGFLAILALAVTLGLWPASAQADTITTYTFSVSGCSGGCSVPAGTVVTDDNGTTTTLTATLNSGYGFFIDTGSHNLFTFSVDDSNIATDITGLSFTFTGSTPSTTISAFSEGSVNNPPFDGFDESIACSNCTPNGKGAVVTGFSFSIADTALGTDGFEADTSDSNPNIFFASDISNTGTASTCTATTGVTCNTGAIGATFTRTSVTTVPEPASLALFGSGLLGLAGVVRRQLKGKK